MNKSDSEKIRKLDEKYGKFMDKNPFQSEIDKIAKDIRKKKDDAMAMEFTKKIGKMLRENGVIPHISENKYDVESVCLNKYSDKQKYGIEFNGLDFTEHDKSFKDEITALKEKLERKETEINQIDYVLNELFGVKHDIVERPDEFKEILKEKAKENFENNNSKAVKDILNENIDLRKQVKELEMELDVKDNLLKIKNGLCRDSDSDSKFKENGLHKCNFLCQGCRNLISDRHFGYGCKLDCRCEDRSEE